MSNQEHDGKMILKVVGRILPILVLIPQTGQWWYEAFRGDPGDYVMFPFERVFLGTFLLCVFLAVFIVDPPWKRKAAKRVRKVKLIQVE